jgi:hypothetical protein
MLVHHLKAYIKAHLPTPQAAHLLRCQSRPRHRCHCHHYQAQPSRFLGCYFVGHSHCSPFLRAYLPPRVTRVTLLRGCLLPPLSAHERQVILPQPRVLPAQSLVVHPQPQALPLLRQQGAIHLHAQTSPLRQLEAAPLAAHPQLDAALLRDECPLLTSPPQHEMLSPKALQLKLVLRLLRQL